MFAVHLLPLRCRIMRRVVDWAGAAPPAPPAPGLEPCGAAGCKLQCGGGLAVRPPSTGGVKCVL